MTSILGLPPMTPELKSISPYLQRADELQAREPVMAYWCAYYAAQVGISLRVKSTPARDLLFGLLSVLERMKKELGPSDAVNIESVSSAYVENFAVKVFAAADNEDRSGEATRSTAKKFLAAANFLEVLKIFPKTPISESSEEKIKYAKWKAADIAKAFREGRKPASGPAGSSSNIDIDLPGQPTAGPSSSPPQPSSSPPQPSASSPSLPAASFAATNGPPSPPLAPGKTSPRRITPPPTMNSEDIARANLTPREFQPRIPPRVSTKAERDAESEEPSSPGSWSTAATPGTDDRDRERRYGYGEQSSPTRGGGNGNGKKSGRGTSRLRNAWVSGEMEGAEEGEEEGQDDPDGGGAAKRTVRFTPSVTGGLTPPVTGGSYVNGPFAPSDSQGASTSPTPPVASSPTPTPPSTVPTIPMSGHQRQTSAPSIPQAGTSPPRRVRGASVSQPNGNSSPPPPSIPIPKPSAARQSSNTTTTSSLSSSNGMGTGASAASSSSSPPRSLHGPSSPPVPVPATFPSAPPLSYAAPDDGPPSPELTPQLIAKAQKHCRFAISALDYEDAEQAKKELRAALAVLGG